MVRPKYVQKPFARLSLLHRACLILNLAGISPREIARLFNQIKRSDKLFTRSKALFGTGRSSVNRYLKEAYEEYEGVFGTDFRIGRRI